MREIVEEAEQMLGDNWSLDDAFDEKIEAGMRQLLDIGIAEGPFEVREGPLKSADVNWWVHPTVFTLRRGYEDRLNTLPPYPGSEMWNETFVGERSRPSLLSRP